MSEYSADALETPMDMRGVDILYRDEEMVLSSVQSLAQLAALTK